MRLQNVKVVLLSVGLLIGVTAQAGGATVKVSREDLPGKVIYHYRVVNETTSNITGIWIGYNYNLGGIPELVSLPVGWSEREIHLIPGSSRSVAPGWKADLINKEDVDQFTLRFEISSIDDRKYIKPGESRDGFSITLPSKDDSYANSHFALFTTNSAPLVGVLSQDEQDTVPPALSISVTPESIWPPNNKMVQVKASITVSDNRDAKPVVKLVSVTCNDGCIPAKDISEAQIGTDDRLFAVKASRSGDAKSGRTYTVRYSASDSAGNTVVKEALIVVPHDQSSNK